jgi:N6-L-threonylcarbamoyladenine synthase
MVLASDNYTCQCCKGKHKDTNLEVHHKIFRSRGGSDDPENLITLCHTCHKSLHEGKINPKFNGKHKGTLNHATQMNFIRIQLLKSYPEAIETFGFITKANRLNLNLPKEHYIDARCISDYPEATHPFDKTVVYYQKKVRCHNRQIHKMTILKGGKRKLNQAEYLVKGYRLFDKVLYHGEEYFIFGRRKSGFFDIRTLDGEKVNKGSISCKKLQLLEIPKGYLIERRIPVCRDGVPPTA